jgi:Carbohydrate esterase, sialic acid-specific acetylesterase
MWNRKSFPWFNIMIPRHYITLICFWVLSVQGPSARAEKVAVYLLSGQSNMQGIAMLEEIPADVPQTIPHAWFWNGQAFEPLVLGKTKTSTRVKEFGPEVGFALHMASVEQPIYLIKYSASGMPLHAGWNGNKWEGGEPKPKRRNFYPGEQASDPNMGTLYREMLALYKAGVKQLAENGKEAEIRGFLWMQGEQDAKNSDSATTYAANLARLRERLAADMQADPNMPMVFGQVLPFEPANPRFTHRNELRAAMANADANSLHPQSLPQVKMVSTDGFGLLPDTVHYNAEGQLRLGKEMAAAMQQLLKKRR